MSRPAILVEDLGKKYLIRHARRERYTALRDVIAESARRLGRRVTSPFSPDRSAEPEEEFWALSGVSFAVQQGDRVGIIGRNGAGKSTLLKIISRITEPTCGRVSIKGRTTSLLEVGTGFHPELTGRENIFLNGAILGMSRGEITRKFDEIVDFAETEKFLDTPVKRYSSGMYVRLAFAVAAHLEPEILIVDEVLAVGDAQFQKKCLGKMGSIATGGSTVLFVSHNMAAVGNLCNRGIVLSRGRATFDGAAPAAIASYASSGERSVSADLDPITEGRRGAREFAVLKSLALFTKHRQPADTFAMGEPMIIRLGIECLKPVRSSRFGVMLTNQMDVLLHDFTSGFDGFDGAMERGCHTFEISVPQVMVYPGHYNLGAWIQRDVGVPSDDYIRSALALEVIDANLVGDPAARFATISKANTEVYVPCVWQRMGG